MTYGRGVGLLAATALAISSLAACGDESDPTQPSTTASPIDKGTDSPSESANASDGASGAGAEELPPAAREQTKAGAIAFTKLWFEQSAKATHSGDPSWLEANTDKRCKPCQGFLDMARKDAEAGLTSNRIPMELGSPAASPRANGDGYRVKIPMKSTQYSMVDANGVKKQTYAGAEYTFVTHTAWEDDGWVLLNWITK